MKKLNGFVRQRETFEGSMAEEYIVYDSFYYSNEYIKKINHTLGIVIWNDEHDEDKREGEVLEANGKICMIKSKSIIFQYSNFHIVNIHNKFQNLYLVTYVLNVVSFP